MDNKELGATARDFDIDPADYVKKGRGGKKVPQRDELIAAILEAQGADIDEAAGEEGDDEDPF